MKASAAKKFFVEPPKVFSSVSDIYLSAANTNAYNIVTAVKSAKFRNSARAKAKALTSWMLQLSDQAYG